MQGIWLSSEEKRERDRERKREGEGGYLVKALPSGSASPTSIVRQTQNNRHEC